MASEPVIPVSSASSSASAGPREASPADARASAEEGPAPSSTFTPAEAKQARRLAYVLVLVSCFFGLELTGAIYARSNVLKADAIHLLMDILALGMSLIAMRVAIRKPTARFTFGLRRAEPVAALLNACLVLGATIEIVGDGIEQLERNEVPAAGLMLVVSIGALFVNGLSAWLLHDAMGHGGHGHGGHGHGGHGHAGHGHGAGHDHGPAHHDHGHALNLRGAKLHLLGDVLGSVAALVAAIGIRMGGPASIDPIASFVVAAILVFGALRLLRDAMLVLFEAAPPHLDLGAIRAIALGVPGVETIHALHAWSLGAGHDAITVHVTSASTDPELGLRVSRKLKKALGVEYVTVQVETPSHAQDDDEHEHDEHEHDEHEHHAAGHGHAGHDHEGHDHDHASDDGHAHDRKR